MQILIIIDLKLLGSSTSYKLDETPLLALFDKVGHHKMLQLKIFQLEQSLNIDVLSR